MKQKLDVLSSNETKTTGSLQMKQKLEVLSSNETKTRGTVFK